MPSRRIRCVQRCFGHLRWHNVAPDSALLCDQEGNGDDTGGTYMGGWRLSLRAPASYLLPSRRRDVASSLRCDHCRGELDLDVHRYWHMRFCSSACMTGYQQRLGPETKVKLCRLDREDQET